MTFGILEDHHDPYPLGTTVLELVQNKAVSKLGTAETVLIPVPSNSPYDPLNFSRVKKEILFMVTMLGTCGTAAIGPLFVPGFGVLAEIFDEPLQRISLLNGCLIITLGVSAYVCGSLAELYGKRLIFLLTTLIVLVTSCWAAAAKSYGSLLGARIIQGCGMGGWFSLAGSAVINDVFFVHQRATRVGLWGVAIVGSTNLTPIITGYVIEDLSWRWTFWLLAIVFGVILGATFFCFPETHFERNTAIVTLQPSEKTLYDAEHAEDTKHAANEVSIPTVSVAEDPEPSSAKWRRALGVERMRFGKASELLPLLLRPLILLLHPAIMWTSATWAISFGWGIVTGLVAAQIFGGPPYNMAPTAIGNLVGIAPLIGSVTASLVSGRLSDYTCEWLATRNRGVFEPEFRLPLIIPAVILLSVGAFGLGAAIENGLRPVICGVFLAIVNAGVGVAATVCISYSNEVAQHRAGEALGVAMLVKSVYAFGLSFAINDFYVRVGPLRFFSTFGGLNVGLGILGGLLWVWGKQCRGWMARLGLLTKVVS